MKYYRKNQNTYIIFDADYNTYILVIDGKKKTVYYREPLTQEDIRTFNAPAKTIPPHLLTQYTAEGHNSGIRVKYNATVLPLETGRTGLTYEFHIEYPNDWSDAGGYTWARACLLKQGAKKELIETAVKQRFNDQAEFDFLDCGTPYNFFDSFRKK